MTENSRY